MKKKGFTLLSDEYINSKTKLKIQCPHGHEYETIWNVWQRGFGCPECSCNKRKTIDEARGLFGKENHVLLSKEYKNNKQKLKYVCPNGKKHEMTLNDWMGGHRCSCFVKNTKKTFAEVRASFEAEGYTLLSKQYRNCNQKLKYICPENHEHQVILAQWNDGKRCPHCRGNAKPTVKDIRKQFESEGYVLFESKYKNGRQRLHYKCPNGHFGTIKHVSWQKGCRCNRCGYDKMSGENNWNWKNFTTEDWAKIKNYKILIKRLTDRNFREYFYLINPKQLPRNKKYHLDHIFSITHGFKNNIHPKIISSPINLRMLTKSENMKKSYKSSITKNELFSLYYQFEEELKGACYEHKFSIRPR